jgi:ribosomal protein L37E
MLTLRCQRCGTDMDMRDPAPGTPWKADQVWVCPRCGRHVWTTYAVAPAAVATEKPPEGAQKP